MFFLLSCGDHGNAIALPCQKSAQKCRKCATREDLRAMQLFLPGGAARPCRFPRSHPSAPVTEHPRHVRWEQSSVIATCRQMATPAAGKLPSCRRGSAPSAHAAPSLTTRRRSKRAPGLGLQRPEPRPVLHTPLQEFCMGFASTTERDRFLNQSIAAVRSV